MKLLVEASGPGNAASEVVEVAALTAESREADVDVRLGAAGRIVVRVTDREHRPVDVPSAASISGGEFHASAQSDTDGTIAVAGVPPGRCFVFVEAEGFCSAGFSVQVRAGRTTRRTARLDRAQTVEGRIVDDLGTPVAGARVWAHEGTSAADDWEAPGAVDADADGRFRIERLEPSSHRLIARTPRHPLAILRGVRPPASDLRVVLPRGVTLRGRFILPAGAPPPDAWFVATAPWRRRGDRPHEWHAQRLWWHGDAFDVPGVPAGDTDFRVRVPGFAGLRQRIRAVPGEVLDLGDVVLDRGVELTGRVVLPDGSPVEGARVGLVSEIASFEHAEAWLNETLTGADGSFRIPGLTPGELELRVSRHGGIAGMFEPQFTLRVTADATPAILTYDPTHVPPEIAELSSRLAGRTVTPGAAPRRRRSAPRRRR
jgi:hypothetical protein